MIIEDLYKEKKSVLSFEIFPPKHGEALKNIDKTLKILCELEPAFISVTCGAGGTGNHDLTIDLARKIKEDYNITPLVHLTSINHSKEEIDLILQRFEKYKIQNILALRGDRNPKTEEKTDFLYASDLAKYIKSRGDFHVSGACYPEVHLEAKSSVDDIINLKTKINNGVTHLISQLFFENQIFYDFIEKINIAEIKVPIVAGIMPVVNKGQVERMVNLCGASLPKKIKKILEKYENDPQALFDAGMIYAMNQVVDLLANDVDGIHIFTMNNPIVAQRITDGIKNII